MSTNIICPECKHDRTSSTHYMSGEEYIYCSKCGYSLDYIMKEEDRKTTKYPCDCKFETKKSGGFGSFKIMFDGYGTCGSFNNKKDIKKFEEDFEKEGGFKTQKGDKADEVEYTFKKNGEWYVKDLIRNIEYLFTKKEILDKLEK